MAIFQFNMQILKRSEGKSAVAAAAYRSGQKLENQYTGTTEDYTKKNWIEYSEVILPSNAPSDFKDREVLWNAVEHAEKGRNARLAREIEVALPVELSITENINLVRNFVQDNFVNDGMIADVNIHCPPVKNESGIPIDKDGNPVTDRNDMVFRNPHAHILLTVRPLDEHGKWMAKSQKEYLCKRDNVTAAFTAEEYRTAKQDGWEKQYQYWMGKKKIWMTPSEAYMKNLVRVSKNPRSTPYGRRDEKAERWNSPDALIQYRQSWEKHANHALKQAGRPERIDSRSYEAQGADTISGLHLGSHASKNTKSDKYRINEDIKALNQANKEIRETIDNLDRQIKEKSHIFYDKLADELGKLESDIISAKYTVESLCNQQLLLKKDIELLQHSVDRIKSAHTNILEKNLSSEKKIEASRRELLNASNVDKQKIKESIREEEDNIQFRKERFSKIIQEEGFADYLDFQQESHILEQMQLDYDELSKRISAFNQKIDGYTNQYEELCHHMPKDASTFEKFCHKREQYANHYKSNTIEYIKRRTGHINKESFQRIVHETNYTLNRTFYLTGKASYILHQLQITAEEQTEDNPHRRL